MNVKSLDPWNITSYYGGQIYLATTLTTIRFLVKGLGHDIVHVHSAYRYVLYFKRLYRQRKVVMHFHGEDVRLKGWDALRQVTERADLTLVSTQDLLKGAPQDVFWLPNPIDIEHFKPMPSLRTAGTALYFVKHQQGEDSLWPQKVANRYGLKLHVHDRVTSPITYSQLPQFLNRFEYYIDRNYISSLSKTALEALACGLEVIAWNEEIMQELPETHEPRNVIEKLWSLYQKMLG